MSISVKLDGRIHKNATIAVEEENNDRASDILRTELLLLLLEEKATTNTPTDIIVEISKHDLAMLFVKRSPSFNKFLCVI